ncbi:unnamed protein product [Rotaria sordida]|uniref:Uncharacterized protein n=1 Tax=Rotaria sordida TaxID=392033 RepID=A0A815LPB7_9BILA|nr:unnamed protein product [Rotaria sordida]
MASACLGDISGPYNLDIASVFDPNDIDIFFLNRQRIRNVRHTEQLIPVFAIPPAGSTPIVRMLRQVLQEKQLEIQERKLLILITTDGVPTDDGGQQHIKRVWV